MVEISTLGGVSVRTTLGPVALRTRKEIGLLVYLAWLEGSFRSRDHFCELFWNSEKAVRAKHSLAQSLYNLKRVLPALEIQKEPGRIRLKPGGVQLDVHTFRDRVSARDYEMALDVYRGPFLNDFWISGAPAFEEWQLSIQRSLTREVIDAARVVMRIGEVDGDWPKVKKFAEFILSLNEFDEEAHRGRALSLAAAGHTGEAFRTVADVRTSSDLPRDMIDEWVTQTQEGIRAIERERTLEGRSTLHAVFPLIGRDTQFLQLRQCWETAKLGRAQIAVVMGTAGVGKTRLCEQLARLAVIQGGRICIGSCFAAERHVPFTGIIEALRGGCRADEARLIPPVWASALAELLPECFGVAQRSSELDPVSGRRRLFEAISVLVTAISERAPCLIYIDDFHWADESTCMLLHYLVRRTADQRIMLLLAMRPEDVPGNSGVWTVIDEQLRSAVQYRVILQPLSRPDCQRIVDVWINKQGFSLNTAVKQSIISRCGGYPYLLLELLKAAPTSSIDAEVDIHSPPIAIQEFLKGRFRTLARPAMELLGVLSVIGRDASADTLHHISNLSSAEVRIGLEELLRKELVSDSAGVISFPHELVREVAYQLLPSFHRRQLHLQVARALSANAEWDAGILAEHFDQAGDKQAAYQFSSQAAEAANSKYAYAETEHYLGLCLSNASTIIEEVSTVQRLAELLYRVKRLTAARPVLERLLSPPLMTLLAPVERTQLRVQQSEVLAATGAERAESILKRLEGLEDEVVTSGDPSAITMFYRLQMRLAHDAGLDDLVLSAVKQLLSNANKFPESSAGIHALRIASTCMAVYVDSRQGWKSAKQALHVAQQFGNAELMVDVLGSHASAAYHRGLLEKAHHSSLQAIRLAESIGAIGSRCRLLNDLGVILTELGDSEGARSAFREVTIQASQMDVPHESITAHANLALVALDGEDYEQANSHCRAVFDLHERHQMDRIYVLALAILGLTALRRARFAEAKRCYRELLPEMRLRKAWTGDFSAVAETFLANFEEHEGRTDAATERLELAIRRSRRVGVTSRCRLQLELARIIDAVDPVKARRTAMRVRRLALRAHARAIVDKADALIDRLNYRLRLNEPSHLQIH